MINKIKKRKFMQDEKHEMVMSELVFLISMLIIGIFFIYIWLAYFGNGLEKYTDIVCEYTSSWNSNKTGEINLVYVLALVGVFSLFIFYSIRYHKGTIVPFEKNMHKNNYEIQMIISALLVATSTFYFIYSGTNPFLFSTLILAIITYILDRELAYDTLLHFVVGLYTLAGIYRLYVQLGGEKKVDVMMIILFSLLLSLIIFQASRHVGTKVLRRAFLIEQLFIPFTMFLFVASKYKVGEEVKTLLMPRRITYLTWILIGLFLILAVKNLKSNWNIDNRLGNAISIGTLMCVMNFNNYSGEGKIISSDLHHPFENIIGFSQIFELGQMPFTDYIPVSGMYSVLQGVFLWFFGKGYYSYYSVTENIFYFLIGVIVIWMLKKHLQDDKVLWLSLLIPIMRYNRVALIIPFMLLLAWPKLINNRNRWLKVWLLTSLINGLYYPVAGASVCVGFLPLGIYQLIKYVRNDFVKDRVKVRFWVEWIICIFPVLVSIPLLLGTLKHMLAMGEQTVYADGISRFGQTVPEDFLGYVQSIGIRLLSYNVCTFLIQVVVVWISAYLAIRVGGFSFYRKKIRCTDVEAATIAASIGISLMISFTYTLVRIDVNSIYARSAGMIFSAVIMIMVFARRFLKNTKVLCILVGIGVFFVAIVSEESVFNFDDADKLEPYYTVAEDCILVEEGDMPKLGQCFVQHSTYQNIESYYHEIENIDLSEKYIGIGHFGHFYLASLRGDSVMETVTIKGYSATQETVDIMKKNKTIANEVDSFSQYYLYYWLLMSGEYVWSPKTEMFYPNVEGLSKEEVQTRHKNIGLAPDEQVLGRTPTSWGSSMDTLEEIFADVSLDIEVSNDNATTIFSFDKSIKGEDADFLYIEFADVDNNYENILFNHSGDVVQTDITWFSEKLMKRDYNRGTVVNIFWNDDKGEQHTMSCALGRGKLLIPLGSGCNWLLHNHDNISISVVDENGLIMVPDINEIKFLKVREVE